jgi:hypothetical protein
MGGTTSSTHGFSQAGSGDGWVYHTGGVYRFHAHLTGGPGGFEAVAATVPGQAGRGGTEAAALDALRDALAASLRQALAAGRSLPKTDPPPTPPGAKERVVVVRLDGAGAV